MKPSMHKESVPSILLPTAYPLVYSSGHKNEKASPPHRIPEPLSLTTHNPTSPPNSDIKSRPLSTLLSIRSSDSSMLGWRKRHEMPKARHRITTCGLNRVLRYILSMPDDGRQAERRYLGCLLRRSNKKGGGLRLSRSISRSGETSKRFGSKWVRVLARISSSSES